MAPGIGMYNFNMTGSSWTGLLQQGMGMLGNGFGGFSGCGIFTNCFGEVNYDAMAGYGVANALLGVAGQAIASNIKPKEPEINYTQEIQNIDKKITEKLEQQADLNTAISEKNDEISEANTKITDLNTRLKGLDLEGKKKAWEDAAKQTPQPANVDGLKQIYDEAVKEAKEIQEKIKAQEEIITAAKEEIKTKEAEVAKLETEIEELEAQKAKLQNASDAKVIKDAKSTSWQRAENECIDNWQQAPTEGRQASKKELKRAIYEYKHADNKTDKQEAAKAVKYMFESNKDELKDFKCIYDAIMREENL